MATRPEAPARAPLLDLDEALARLAAAGAAARIAAVETVATHAALGRVLAADLVSQIDVPPAATSAMDGYALHAADAAGAASVLVVSQRIAAGQVGVPLAAGEAARIFTGAPLPPGADAVLMQERAEPVAGAQPPAVRLLELPQPGQWVRQRGEDVRRGSVVLAAGTRLTPQALGLAATTGAAELAVVRRPRVALLSSGDELVRPGSVAPAALPPGAIYDSNRDTLRALLQAAGCEVSDCGAVPDRLAATRAALREAAADHDLILSSGGVSVGEEDHLRPALAAEGRIELWQVAIKPGKPLAFGAVRRAAGGEALYVGLPGNPVSSFVTFLLAVRTLLRALQGADCALPPPLPLSAGFDWPRPDARREFLRVRLGAEGRLELYPNQSSGVLTSTVWADGLVDNPPAQAIRAGDRVRYLPLSSLIGG